MARIWVESGLKFHIWPNDHRPAHVHVLKAGGEVVINLGSKQSRPEIREVKGKISDRDIVKALRIACEQQELMLEKWRNIHGRD